MGFFSFMKPRPKSALMRDRKYKSKEPHEQAYKRKTSPKNPHYKLANGGGVGSFEEKQIELALKKAKNSTDVYFVMKDRSDADNIFIVPKSLYLKGKNAWSDFDIIFDTSKNINENDGGVDFDDIYTNIPLGAKVIIVKNLDDHKGYEGEELEVVGADDDNYYNVENGKGGEWYVGEEELEVVGKYKKGGKVKNKKWIQGALSGKEGTLRKTAMRKGLLKDKDDTLSKSDLHKLEKMGGKTAKRAYLAETLSKFDDGGEAKDENYYHELWKTNGVFDDIINGIVSEIQSNPDEDKSVIASDIIDSENFHGDRADIVKGREYIIEKVKEKGYDVEYLYGNGGQTISEVEDEDDGEVNLLVRFIPDTFKSAELFDDVDFKYSHEEIGGDFYFDIPKSMDGYEFIALLQEKIKFREDIQGVWQVYKGKGGDDDDEDDGDDNGYDIENLYEGRTDEGIWDAGWSDEQKGHFINDHFPTLKEWAIIEQIILSNYDDLNEQVKVEIRNHLHRGQYKHGGGIKTFFKKAHAGAKEGYGKAKEVAKQAHAGAKDGYGKAKAHVDKKVHDKKRDIAWNVIQETRGIVEDKKESQLLNEASNLVEEYYAKGGKVGKQYTNEFEEVYDGEDDQYYIRNWGYVIIGDDDKRIELVCVANIRNLENAIPDDELPQSGNFELDFTLVPRETFLSKKFVKTANDDDNSISDNTIVNIVNYMSGLRYDPREGTGVSKSQTAYYFKTAEDAKEYMMSKKLNDVITVQGGLSGFTMDKHWNRAGQTNWDYLNYMIGATDKFFAKGGEVKKSTIFLKEPLLIESDAKGDLYFDFDFGRGTGWAFDTDDVGVAVSIMHGSRYKTDPDVRKIKINKSQLAKTDKKQVVYWLSGGNVAWRFSDQYKYDFDKTYKDLWRKDADELYAKIQKCKTIGELLDMYSKDYMDYPYFFDSAMGSGYDNSEDDEEMKNGGRLLKDKHNFALVVKNGKSKKWTYFKNESDARNFFDIEKDNNKDVGLFEKAENGKYEVRIDSHRPKFGHGGTAGVPSYPTAEVFDDNFDYGSDLTDEATVRDNFVDGEIAQGVLEQIIGRELDRWNDDVVLVGLIKLRRCFLRPYYKID